MKKNINWLVLSGLMLSMSLYGMTASAEDTSTEPANQEQKEVATEDTKLNDITESTTTESLDSNSSNEKETTDASKVVETIDKAIGEKKGEDVPVDSKPRPSIIRDELLSQDYGITKDELDKYTDEQLENTMTLFTRYNYDITGMDYGAYARLLTTLYVDKTVNIENALTQLSFDPASFNSYADMIPQVEQLQIYLKTLYPVNSTFLPGVSITNEQLIAKLKKLQVIEDEAKANGQTLPFGRIAGLLQSDTDDSSDSSSTDSTTSESTTASTQKDKVTPTSSSNKKDGSLPKTGEKQNGLVLATLGVFSILGASYVLSKKS